MSASADKLAAARGLAALPPEASLELLVALAADDDAEVRAEARRTLDSWDGPTLQPLLARRTTSPEVLEFFLRSGNVRPEVLPAVLANRHAPQDAVADLAAVADLETIKVLLDNIDTLRTPALVALRGNSSYQGMTTSRLAAIEEGFLFEPSFLELLIAEAQIEDERQQIVPLTEEELDKLDHEIAQAEASGNEEKKHESMYAKVARMTVSQKVQLALKGTKDERSLLVRDSSKVVSRAVLGSPKVTEAEVEGFAALKSVSDEVLRMMSMSRKFMKNYNVVRNLANNPKTPLDIGLPLLNRLLPPDQKAVAGNRNVSDVLRKMADKLVKQKAK